MSALHSSATNEHFTPHAICEAARKVLGAIDLDPASCEEANVIVQAGSYYDAQSNGFTKLWSGRVFLNPPGGKADSLGHTVTRRCSWCDMPKCNIIHPVKSKMKWKCGGCEEPRNVKSSAVRWWGKLMGEKGITAAIFIGYSLELLQTIQADGYAKTPLEFPICYPKKRIEFISPGGTVGSQPTHGNFIALVTQPEFAESFTWRFAAHFGKFGQVVIPDNR